MADQIIRQTIRVLDLNLDHRAFPMDNRRFGPDNRNAICACHFVIGKASAYDALIDWEHVARGGQDLNPRAPAWADAPHSNDWDYHQDQDFQQYLTKIQTGEIYQSKEVRPPRRPVVIPKPAPVSAPKPEPAPKKIGIDWGKVVHDIFFSPAPPTHRSAGPKKPVNASPVKSESDGPGGKFPVRRASAPKPSARRRP